MVLCREAPIVVFAAQLNVIFKKMKSIWSIFTNTNNESGSEIILKKIKEKLNNNCDEVVITPYHKGGFKIQFTIQHKNPNWKNNIYDIIELSQRIGNAWQLFGDLNLDPSSVTQEANISGVEMIEWKIIKN